MQELFCGLGEVSYLRMFFVGLLQIGNEFMQTLENYKTSHV